MLKSVVSVAVVVPAYNELQNLEVLVPRIVAELQRLGVQPFVVIVDDGSVDGTAQWAKALTETSDAVALVSMPRNMGKAAALQRGFAAAEERSPDVVAMMDADGQDDPSEFGRLLERLDEGHDLVTGARLLRQDRFIKRTTSRLYNLATRLLSGVPGRDFNSGFKVMRPETARNLMPMLYGELHRYITVIAFWQGARIAEVSVTHHRRMHGKSKYGIARFWRGFLDLLTIRFLMSYRSRPLHLFGGVGLISAMSGGAILTYLLVLRVQGEAIGGRPLLVAGLLLVIVGFQLLLSGLLAELLVFTRSHGPRS